MASKSLALFYPRPPLDIDPNTYIFLALCTTLLLLAFLTGCWSYWCCCTATKSSSKKLNPGYLHAIKATTLYQIPNDVSLPHSRNLRFFYVFLCSFYVFCSTF